MSAIILGAAFNPATERVSWSSIQVSSDPIPISQALAPHTPAQANNSHQLHPQATHPPPLPGSSWGNSPPTFWEAPSTRCKIPCLITKQQIFQVENSLDFPFQRHPLLPLCRQPPMHGTRRFTKLFLHPPPLDTGAVREFSWNSVCGRVQVLF